MRYGQKLIERVGFMKFWRIHHYFLAAKAALSDLLLHFQNNIRRCMNSIAILILTNFIMPLLTFFVLKWILNETFHIAIPTPSLPRHRHKKGEAESGSELVAVGGNSHDE